MSSSSPAADVTSLTDDGDDAKRNNIIHPPRSRDAGSGVEGDSRDTDADDTDADDSEDERELAEERRKEAESRAASTICLTSLPTCSSTAPSIP